MQRSTRNLLIALGALVLLIAVGFAGYRIFSGKAEAELARVQGETVAKQEGGAGSSKDAMMLSSLDATVYTSLNESITLTAIANGKPLVVNFWATWCPYCVDEMPDFLEIYREYQDRVAFAFVDVTDGQREKTEDAKAWLEAKGFSELPAYFDTSLALSGNFGAYSLPTTAVIDAKGEVLTLRPGRIDAALMRGALNTLVS